MSSMSQQSTFNSDQHHILNIPSYLKFDNTNYDWKPDINYRQHPELYKIGKGEQGVLIVQPYKDEIGPYWRFKSPEIAEESSLKILELFYNYLNTDDFIGADMARKYLQMGYTRSRRYFNYKSGRKYKSLTYEQLPRGTGDYTKSLSADIFYQKWMEASRNPKYIEMKKIWNT